MSQGTYNVNAEVGEDQPMYRGGLGMGDEVEMMIDEDEAPVYRSLGGGAPEPPAMPGLCARRPSSTSSSRQSAALTRSTL